MNYFSKSLLTVFNDYNNFLFYKKSTIFVEITTYCNLKCQGCIRTQEDYASKNKHMALDDFKLYVDQLPAGKVLQPQGIGEAALNPDLAKMIAYAKKTNKFSEIYFNTNAHIKLDIYDELFEAGLDQLSISVDSLTDTVHELRAGTDLERLKKNIAHLAKKYCDKISVRTVVSHKNSQELPFLAQELMDLGVRRMDINDFFEYDSRTSHPQDVDYAEIESKTGMKIHAPSYQKWKKVFNCKQPWMNVVVTVDGHVVPCCVIYDPEIIHFGSLKEFSFAEIWDSPVYRNFRKTFNSKTPELCKSCNFYTLNK